MMRFLFYGMVPAGSLLDGLLASTIGLRGALWVSAIGVLGASRWVVFSPLRKLHDLPERLIKEKAIKE